MRNRARPIAGLSRLGRLRSTEGTRWRAGDGVFLPRTGARLSLGDAKDDFAVRVAGHRTRKRLGGVGEREDLSDHRSELPVVDQRSELDQLLPVGLHDEEKHADRRVRPQFCGRLLGD